MEQMSYGQPPLQPYVVPPPKRRRPLAAVALGVGLAGALVGGAFAAVNLGASDGAETPEAAVEALFDAIAAEDALGVLESLAPGERSALRPGLEDLAAELERLGVVSEELDLGAVAGFDIEIDGLTVEADELAEGISTVEITGGTISASTSPDELPIGDTVDGILDDLDADLDDLDSERTTEDLATDEGVLVAIEEDGGWHVSLGYTIAENARVAAGLPEPDFGDGVEPVGAESPEDAVREALDAAVGLDVRRLIELLPPDEAAALHDYAPLFLDDVEDAADDAQSDFELGVEDLQLDVVEDGDTAVATMETFELAGEADGSEVGFTWDGECFRVTEDDEEEELTCEGDVEDGDFPEGIDPTVTLVERDGEWFLSPTRTILGGLVIGLQGTDADDLEDAIDSFLGLVLGTGLGEVDTFPTEEFPEEEFPEEEFPEEEFPEEEFPEEEFPEEEFPEEEFPEEELPEEEEFEPIGFASDLPAGSAPGTCFLVVDVSGDVEEVPCEAPHNYEVFAAFPLEGAEYPGDDEVFEEAFARCEVAFEPYVGTSFAESEFFFEQFAPTEESFSTGDREVLCAIDGGFDGLLIGTAQGSGR